MQDRVLRPPEPPPKKSTLDHARELAEAIDDSARTGGLRRIAVQSWSWRNWVAAAAALIAVIWYLIVPALLGPATPVDTAIRTAFVQTVVASGHVEAPFRVSIGSQITGVVVEIPVSEGQAVKSGDTLIVLDDREATAAVAQAEGVVRQWEARVRQINEVTLPAADEALKQARATLLNAQQTYDRANKLARDGYGTQAALDDATRALDIAHAQMRAAELQVYTSRPGGSDYVMAETQLNQARANLDTAKSRLSYTLIKAPRDGILIARNVERGNVVQPSAVLMLLSPSVETQLVVQIDEKNLSLISLGQKALASADAFPRDRFEAEITYINPGIDLQRASVQVKLRVPKPPEYLKQDMTVSIDIETGRKPDAVVLPAASVRNLTNGAPWVLKVSRGKAVRQPVKVGLTGGGMAEITEGLAPGDNTVPSTNTAIKEGNRLRPRPMQGRQP